MSRYPTPGDVVASYSDDPKIGHGHAVILATSRHKRTITKMEAAGIALQHAGHPVTLELDTWRSITKAGEDDIPVDSMGCEWHTAGDGQAWVSVAYIIDPTGAGG